MHTLSRKPTEVDFEIYRGRLVWMMLGNAISPVAMTQLAENEQIASRFTGLFHRPLLLFQLLQVQSRAVWSGDSHQYPAGR